MHMLNLHVVCRGHSEDVWDVSWSSDCTALATASTDNETVIFDARPECNGARAKSRLQSHSHYVQGVAWDPLRAHLATQSCDRSCRCRADLLMSMMPMA